MKTKEQIQAKLKEMGYNAKMVSVSVRHSSVTVTVRNASINPTVIENAVKGFEQISRCEASGEILSGGNTFVGVAVSEEVEKIWAGQFMLQVEEAISKMTDDRTGVTIFGNYVLFMQYPGCYSVSYFDADGSGSRVGFNAYYSAKGISLAIYRHTMDMEQA